MTTGLKFVVCLQEAGWNQARRIQYAVFLPPVQCSEKGCAKYTTNLFNPASRPGLSCKRAVAFMCVPN